MDAGATAHLLCFRLIERHNRILHREGFPRVPTYLGSARFELGDGCLEAVRRAADIPSGIAGNRGELAAFALGTKIPALLHTGALEALGGQLDFSRDISRIRKQGVLYTQARSATRKQEVPFTFLRGIPLRVNRIGRCKLSVVNFGKGQSEKQEGPTFSASYFQWASANRRPDLSDGSLRLLYEEDGLYHFEHPHTFSACKAGTFRGATDGCLSGPKESITKLHLNWGHASAQQLKRAPAASDGDDMHLVNHADEVLEQRDVCRAFDKAPTAPITGNCKLTNCSRMISLPCTSWAFPPSTP